jgi:hypothetical protein
LLAGFRQGTTIRGKNCALLLSHPIVSRKPGKIAWPGGFAETFRRLAHIVCVSQNRCHDSLSFRFDNGRITRTFLHDVPPLAAALVCLAALSCWAGFLYVRRRLQVTGL